MKKIRWAFILLGLMTTLTGCFWNKDDETSSSSSVQYYQVAAPVINCGNISGCKAP